MIRHDEEWVQIAYIDEKDQIFFTPQFIEMFDSLSWGAKQFVGWLMTIWYDPFEHLLDYTTGDSKFTPDQPGEYSNNDITYCQDVVEYWAVRWSLNNNAPLKPQNAGLGEGFTIEWYRDILRAKLVSLKIPKRLLQVYISSYRS